MSKITLILQEHTYEYFSRYEEDDESIRGCIVCKNLPEAKETLKKALQKALDEVDKIQLKDIK